MAVQTNKILKPRANAATSIPGLLGIFHNEWDALMLETLTLRESLESRSKELATALYQYDAACRVIARLEKERDDARAGLAAAPAAAKRGADGGGAEGFAPGGGAAAGGWGGGGFAAKRAKQGLPDDVLASVDAVAASLSAARRKRMISGDLATADEVSRYRPVAALPLHKTASPGVLALALHPARPGVSASGGVDRTVVLFDRGAAGGGGGGGDGDGRLLASLKGHTKEVTSLAFVGPSGLLLSGSEDRTAKLWAPEEGGSGDGGGWRCAATLSGLHGCGVAGVAPHPGGELAATAGRDGGWGLWDVRSAQLLWRCDAPAADGAPAAAAAFHPDGLILATAGGDGAVRVWDAKTGAVVAKLEKEAAAGAPAAALSALAFSENGYQLAAAGDAGVALWDLRKLKCLRELVGGGSGAMPHGPTTAPSRALAFDHSGHFLAAGHGDAACVYAAKQDWACVAQWAPPRAGGAAARCAVAALAWAPDAAALLVGAHGDHNVRVYARAAEAGGEAAPEGGEAPEAMAA